MKKLLEKIEKESKNVTLYKGVVVSFCVYLAYFIFYVFYGWMVFKPVIITIGIYLLIHAFIYLLLKKGVYKLARWLFIWLSVLFLINLTFFIAGPETGVHYFLLIFSLLALSLAQPHRLWLSVVYFSISLFFFSGAEFGFLPDLSVVDYPDTLAYVIRVQCIVLSFVLIYYISYLFYRINLDKEKHILAQNDELQRVNKQLEQSQHDITSKNEQMISLNEELVANLELISKQKDEMELTNTSRELFLSIIAHDLKNPLSSIIGLTEILQLNIDSYPKEKMKEFLDGIYDSANRIDILLMNLLNWAKAQTGNLKPNQSEWLLKDLLNANQKLFFQNLKDKNLSLQNNCSENITIKADRDMIDTVVRNLMSNAIKFTRKGGLITLSDELTDDKVVVHITDNGIGMDEDTLGSLFDKDKSISYGTNSERGMGLGLLICKEFLEANGCSLMVKSQKEQGTTFSILFPK